MQPKSGAIRQGAEHLGVARSNITFHTCNGVPYSWLCTPDPTRFLLREEDVRVKNVQGGFKEHFLIPAMRSPFSEFILDILVRDDGLLNLNHGIVVLHLPDGAEWQDARIVHTIGWEDIFVRSSGVEHWRKWKNAWFADIVGSPRKF